MIAPDVELRIRQASGNWEAILNPEPMEVAEVITNFEELKDHRIDDVSLAVHINESEYRGRLSLCLAIPGYAVATYSDSRNPQQIYVRLSPTLPLTCETFEIDDGGGDKLELSTKFLIARSVAIDYAIEFLGNPQFDLHNEIETWGDYPECWH